MEREAVKQTMELLLRQKKLAEQEAQRAMNEINNNITQLQRVCKHPARKRSMSNTVSTCPDCFKEIKD